MTLKPLMIRVSLLTYYYCIIGFLATSTSGPLTSGLSLDLQKSALRSYGYELSDNPGLMFTAEQELEIRLSLYRRTLCLTNGLLLDVPISSSITDDGIQDAVYEIKGTQYRFADNGCLLRQAFTLHNPVNRDSSGKLVYSTAGIPNFMANNLVSSISSLSSANECK